MANPDAGFDPGRATDIIYDDLVAQGVEPRAAADISESATRDSRLHVGKISQSINQAWDQVPATIPDADRAGYALAILTAMRGNYAPWNKLLANPDKHQPWMDSVRFPNPDEGDDLAYAQHYMHDRYVVAKTGDISGAEQHAAFYDWVKQQGFTLPTSGRASTPGPASLWWAAAGRLDGQRSFQTANPGSPGVPFGAWMAEGGNIDVAGRLVLRSADITNALLGAFKGMMNTLPNIPVGFPAAMCSAPGGAPTAEMSVSASIISK